MRKKWPSQVSHRTACTLYSPCKQHLPPNRTVINIVSLGMCFLQSESSTCTRARCITAAVWIKCVFQPVAFMVVWPATRLCCLCSIVFHLQCLLQHKRTHTIHVRHTTLDRDHSEWLQVPHILTNPPSKQRVTTDWIRPIDIWTTRRQRRGCLPPGSSENATPQRCSVTHRGRFADYHRSFYILRRA